MTRGVQKRLVVCLVAVVALLVGIAWFVKSGPTKKSVRVLYLIPKDREFRKDYQSAIESCVLDLQTWYHDRLNGKTFRLNDPIVEIIHTPNDSLWYDTNIPVHPAEQMHYTYYNALTDAAILFGIGGEDSSYVQFVSDPDFVWLIYIDAPGGTGAGETGVAILPRHDLQGLSGKASDQTPISRWIGGSGHELGHAFGLPHSGEVYADALMEDGYAAYPVCYLTEEDITTLNDSPFFHQGRPNALIFGRAAIRKLSLLAASVIALVGLWIYARGWQPPNRHISPDDPP